MPSVVASTPTRCRRSERLGEEAPVADATDASLVPKRIFSRIVLGLRIM